MASCPARIEVDAAGGGGCVLGDPSRIANPVSFVIDAVAR
jgi:hypothetical protein